MNLVDFTETEKSFKKTVRILVYPNITFQKDLEKDSYVQVIKNQIKLLNELRDDLWFYLILTEPTESLSFDNVTQMYIDLPTYPPTMRSHFDVQKIKDLLGHDLDFDLVMSHLPEHTHQLMNTMHNVTHHTPPVFGYCHWFDVKDVVAWYKDSFLQNMTGLLQYDKCYLNTLHQKELVLKQAKETFNDATIKKLDKILSVQHLGVNEKDIIPSYNPDPEKIIVFNHRTDSYKHFKDFITVCDELWDMRQDFKVWIPLLDQSLDREYITTEKGNKDWYYKQLQKCYVGFSPKQKYGGWSVATTDGMMNGVPYIMYDDTYYHELYQIGDFYKNIYEAVQLLNVYLDDPRYRNEEADKCLDWTSKYLVYKNTIKDMSNYIDDLLSKQKVMGDSDTLKEIINHIKTNKSVTKKDLGDFLGWGRGIKFTPYRRALMNHPNIFDTFSNRPTYNWIE